MYLNAFADVAAQLRWCHLLVRDSNGFVFFEAKGQPRADKLELVVDFEVALLLAEQYDLDLALELGLLPPRSRPSLDQLVQLPPLQRLSFDLVLLAALMFY